MSPTMHPEMLVYMRRHWGLVAALNTCAAWTVSALAGLGWPQRLASITIRKGRFCATGSLQNELPL
jgi:hypothetical protein